MPYISLVQPFVLKNVFDRANSIYMSILVNNLAFCSLSRHRSYVAEFVVIKKEHKPFTSIALNASQRHTTVSYGSSTASKCPLKIFPRKTTTLSGRTEKGTKKCICCCSAWSKSKSKEQNFCFGSKQKTKITLEA